MNYPNEEYQPLMSYPPPKKAFPVAFVVLGVAALLIMLAIFGGIKVFHAAQAGSSEAITVGNRFIDAMGKHNYQAAYSLFTPQVQEKMSMDDLKDMEALVEKHHGTFLSPGKPQWFIQNYNGQTSVRLTYPAQFTKSSSSVSMTLVQTDKGYQVYSANYAF
ncbi:MAG: hypothetical protein ACRYFS_15615 [Janthinobacterium lividum]